MTDTVNKKIEKTFNEADKVVTDTVLNSKETSKEETPKIDVTIPEEAQKKLRENESIIETKPKKPEESEKPKEEEKKVAEKPVEQKTQPQAKAAAAQPRMAPKPTATASQQETQKEAPKSTDEPAAESNNEPQVSAEPTTGDVGAPVQPSGTVNLTIAAGTNCDDATLYVNDEIVEFGTPVKVKKNSEVTVNIVKTGCVSVSKAFQILEEDVTKTYNLELKKFKLIIKNLQNANVTVNDVKFTQVVAYEYGTKITVKATKENHQPFEKVIDSLTKETTVNVKMKLNTFTLTVTPTPEDAEVSIENGKETVKVTGEAKMVVAYGSRVNVTVSKEGYQSITNNYEILKEETKAVEIPTLECNLKVIAVPSDATVTLTKNAEQPVTAATITGAYGDKVKISVAKDKFTTFEKEVTLTKDNMEETVILESTDGKVYEEMLIFEAKRIFKITNNYSYLNISRYIIQEGVTVESLRKFYGEFGAYVTTANDHYLWHLMNAFFDTPEVVAETKAEETQTDETPENV